MALSWILRGMVRGGVLTVVHRVRVEEHGQGVRRGRGHVRCPGPRCRCCRTGRSTGLSLVPAEGTTQGAWTQGARGAGPLGG